MSAAPRGPRVEVGNPGAMHFVYRLVAALQALGYQGRFHTGLYYKPAAWRPWLAALPPGLRGRAERQLRRRHEPAIDPARVVCRPGLEALGLIAGRLGLPAAAGRRLLGWRNRAADRRLAALVARERPAAVIAHDTAALETFRAAGRAGTLAVLNQVIGHRVAAERLLSEEARRNPAFAASLGHRPDPALTEACRREALAADHLLAPSDYVAATLREIGVPAERISLLPYGVDLERFRPRADPRRAEGPLRLLFVGQLSQRKGLSYLLEALRQLPPGLCQATLVGPPVVERAALAPYAALFAHRPAVPHHEVHRLFAEADLFVYPSLHEGSALAIYEALASGLPVVTTANSGSLVRDGEEGLLVPPGEAEALAAAIRALAEDEPRRRTMAEAARRRAEGYGWDAYRARLGAIMTRLVGPPEAP